MKFRSVVKLITLCFTFICANAIAQGGISGDASFADPFVVYSGAATTVQWGDVDADGMSDLFVAEGGRHSGGAGSRIFAWFKAPNWERFDVAETLGPFTGDSDLVDVDADGDLDIVIAKDSHSSGSSSDAVYWYENTGNFGSDWPQHIIEFDVPDAFHIGDLETGDVDGDGKLDVVVRHLSTLRFVVYFQNSSDDWLPLRLEAKHREGLAVADLDGNGRADIIGNGYILFAPQNPRTESWAEKTFDSAFYSASQSGLNNSVKTEIADMDNDGKKDIIMSSAEGQAVYLAWYKNPVNSQDGEWVRTPIEDPQGKNHQVQIADIDLDGDVDIFGGFSFGASGVYWWENVDGDAESWSRHTIVNNRGCYSCVAADFDGDGDVDFAGPQTYTGQVNLFENTTSVSLLEVSQNRLDFMMAGGTQAIGVVSDISWTVGSNQIWASASPEGGSNDQSIDISVAAYDGIGDRLAIIDVSGGGITREIQVVQTGMEDLIPPSTPENLQIDELHFNRVEISWSPSTDNSGTVAAYRVYQDGQPLTSKVVEGTQVSVTNILPLNSYSFAVTALDLADNESSLSNPLMVITPARPPGLQPFAYWGFNESTGLVAYDEIGNHDGALVNMQGTEWSAGLFGNALQFDGTDDRVNLGTLNFSNNTLTISAWIKPSGLSSHPEGRILSKASGNTGAAHDWMLSTIEQSGESRLRFRLKINGVTHTLIANSGSIFDDQWVHLAATYDGQYMRIYKDAVLVGELNQIGQIEDSTTVVAIGNQPQGDRPFLGQIDDVCLFNEALDLLQIESLNSASGITPCIGKPVLEDVIFIDGFESG